MSDVTYGDFTIALDKARRVAPNKQEYWMARDLQRVVNYARWENFEQLVQKAKIACESSGVESDHQFRPVTKLITAGKGALRQVSDWYLSRYACYLIAMNGDPQVPEIAFAQQYFAVQTRIQEQQVKSVEQYDRVEHRKRVTATVKALSSAAKRSGVQRYGLFWDAGYKGLYGGLGLSAIKARKNLGEKEELLDRAGRVELAAIELKNAQTEEQLISRNIKGEQRAMDTHHRVGKEIRSAIERIGGTMPENLASEESIKKIESARRKKPSKQLPELRLKAPVNPESPKMISKTIEKVAGCAECEKDSPVSHLGSENCTSGSLASGGARAHCTCDLCF
jgi:DNA-damage-inducible protein D